VVIVVAAVASKRNRFVFILDIELIERKNKLDGNEVLIKKTS
jgi:hypothetical protein